MEFHFWNSIVRFAERRLNETSKRRMHEKEIDAWYINDTAQTTLPGRNLAGNGTCRRSSEKGLHKKEASEWEEHYELWSSLHNRKHICLCENSNSLFFLLELRATVYSLSAILYAISLHTCLATYLDAWNFAPSLKVGAQTCTWHFMRIGLWDVFTHVPLLYMKLRQSATLFSMHFPHECQADCI